MNYKFEPLNMKEHRRCPKCGKLMIKRDVSTELDAKLGRIYPVKRWGYWCNCGWTIDGGILKGVPELTWAKREWERVNNIE